MDVDRLVVLSNQIGGFFATRAEHRAIERIAEHLRNFWDAALQAELITYVENGGGGLDPLVKEAVKRLSG